MERRSFLKIVAGGAALAIIASKTPSILSKPNEVSIRELEWYDGIDDQEYKRLDWSNGREQFGIDIKLENRWPYIPNNKTKQNKMEKAAEMENEMRWLLAVETLLDHIKQKTGSIYGSIRIPFHEHAITNKYIDIPKKLKRKYS